MEQPLSKDVPVAVSEQSIPTDPPLRQGEPPPSSKGRFEIEIKSVYYYPERSSIRAAVVLNTSFILHGGRKLSKYISHYKKFQSPTSVRTRRMPNCRLCARTPCNHGLSSERRRTCSSRVPHGAETLASQPSRQSTGGRSSDRGYMG